VWFFWGGGDFIVALNALKIAVRLDSRISPVDFAAELGNGTLRDESHSSAASNFSGVWW
jgi:hypothetical protein